MESISFVIQNTFLEKQQIPGFDITQNMIFFSDFTLHRKTAPGSQDPRKSVTGADAIRKNHVKSGGGDGHAKLEGTGTYSPFGAIISIGTMRPRAFLP